MPIVRFFFTLVFIVCSVAGYSRPSYGSELISFSQLKRLGAFRVPNDDSNYARGVIEINPVNHSFYLVGHEHRNHVAEFGLPATLSSSVNLNTLSTAIQTQDYQNIMQHASGGNSELIEKIGGLKLITDSSGNQKLIGAGYEYYDTSGQTYTHFVVDDPDDLASSNVGGYFPIEGPARKQSGYMVTLPPKWRQIFGKTHIAGQSSGLPIIGGLSVGPAAYAVNLSEIGNQANPDTITLLEYDLSQTLNPGGSGDLANASRNNDIWTHLSRAVGAFVYGDTLGFLGHSGGHNEGIGYKTSIVNPCTGTGGYGANNCDYDYHYWFYDLNELEQVMDGNQNAHDIQPYEHGPFFLPFGDGRNGTGGIATDPSTGRIYLTQLSADREASYSNLPLIQVFEITGNTLPGPVNPSPTSTNLPFLSILLLSD